MHDIEKVYEEYFETVYKYLFCLTHNQDLAEELTQETFYLHSRTHIIFMK